MGFWKRWGIELTRRLDATFSRIAIVTSIVAFFGLTFSKIPFAWTALVVLGAWLLLLIVLSKPPYRPPPNFSEVIDLEAVNEFLATTPKVAILGLEAVGKTTFLQATVARQPSNRQTSKPYGQLVSLADTSPHANVVLLDSVGAKQHTQFALQQLADAVVLMVDHSPSSTASVIHPGRIEAHIALAKQIIHAAVDNNVIVDRVIIAANKSDLWQSDEKAADAVRNACEQIVDLFRDSPAHRRVILRIPYSNESRADIADLLREAADVA